jgi:DNA-binding transcriptional ArsR family regulator
MTDQFVETLKALADPLRLRMIAILDCEELAVGELAEVLGISQPRVSHHLKTLREAELIQVRRDGAWTFCSPAVGRSDGESDGGLVTALAPWAGSLDPPPADLRKLAQVLEKRRERSRQFFDAAAKHWESLEPCFEGTGIRHQALSSLLPGELVFADVGCGTGFMTRALATRAKKVILIDHSAVMLEKAKTELTGFAADLEFRVGELDCLPLADAEVDGAFVNLVLHHVPDLRTTVSELQRVIRPGGSLLISDLWPHDAEWLRDEHADLRLGLDPEQLAEIAREAGFTDIRIENGADQLRTRSQGGQEILLPLFVMKAGKKGSDWL